MCEYGSGTSLSSPPTPFTHPPSPLTLLHSPALAQDVIDEMIAEVCQETSTLQKAADEFAFDLLVEAVAYSQVSGHTAYWWMYMVVKGVDMHDP